MTATAVRPHVPPAIAELGWSGLFTTPVPVNIRPDEMAMFSAKYLRRLRNDGWFMVGLHQWFGEVWAVMVRRDENAIIDIGTGRLMDPLLRLRRELQAMEIELRDHG